MYPLVKSWIWLFGVFWLLFWVILGLIALGLEFVLSKDFVENLSVEVAWPGKNEPLLIKFGLVVWVGGALVVERPLKIFWE
jgi:hypothetical protein